MSKPTVPNPETQELQEKSASLQQQNAELKEAHAADREQDTLKERIASLEAENAKLRAKIDPRVKEKMAAGLSREQAETAVAQQDAHDAQARK